MIRLRKYLQLELVLGVCAPQQDALEDCLQVVGHYGDWQAHRYHLQAEGKLTAHDPAEGSTLAGMQTFIPETVLRPLQVTVQGQTS